MYKKVTGMLFILSILLNAISCVLNLWAYVASQHDIQNLLVGIFNGFVVTYTISLIRIGRRYRP